MKTRKKTTESPFSSAYPSRCNDSITRSVHYLNVYFYCCTYYIAGPGFREREPARERRPAPIVGRQTVGHRRHLCVVCRAVVSVAALPDVDSRDCRAATLDDRFASAVARIYRRDRLGGLVFAAAEPAAVAAVAVVEGVVDALAAVAAVVAAVALLEKVEEASDRAEVRRVRRDRRDVLDRLCRLCRRDQRGGLGREFFCPLTFDSGSSHRSRCSVSFPPWMFSPEKAIVSPAFL